MPYARRPDRERSFFVAEAVLASLVVASPLLTSGLAIPVPMPDASWLLLTFLVAQLSLSVVLLVEGRVLGVRIASEGFPDEWSRPFAAVRVVELLLAGGYVVLVGVGLWNGRLGEFPVLPPDDRLFVGSFFWAALAGVVLSLVVLLRSAGQILTAERA